MLGQCIELIDAMNRYIIPLVILLSGCAAHHNTDIINEREIVGVWTVCDFTVQSVILRKIDGTYQQKVARIGGHGKSALVDMSEGIWRIHNGYYYKTITKMSSSKWADEIGKENRFKIISLSPGIFKHLSSDNAVVEERRIGSQSQAQFDEYQLNTELENGFFKNRFYR